MRRVIQEQNESIQISRARSCDRKPGAQHDAGEADGAASGAFGGMALLLAAVGLYGVWLMASLGRDRTRSGFAWRSARGGHGGEHGAARDRHDGRTGLAGGVALALAATRLVQSRLFGLQGWDPLTIVIGYRDPGPGCPRRVIYRPGAPPVSIRPLHSVMSDYRPLYGGVPPVHNKET